MTAVQQLGTAVVKMVLAAKKETVASTGYARRMFTGRIKHVTCNFYRLLCEGFKLVCGISSLPL